MDQKLTEKITSFRRQIHQHPEIGMKQIETRERIKNILSEFGIKQNQMFETQPTALHVDIYGKGAPSEKPKCVGFRADMDALSMVQKNQNLQYISKNYEAAHMCGHDGHVACLVGFVPLLQQKLDLIPSNRRIRLLFQPSEEGPESGAKKMIENGCIDEVDEVYGFHNLPLAPLGQIWCMQGPVMAQSTDFHIKIIGTSGHGSEPEKLKQSTRAGVKFYSRAMECIDSIKQQNKGLFVSSIPVFQSGERFNVISQSCYISGTIRSFKKNLREKAIDMFIEFLEDLVKEGFKYEFSHNCFSPVLQNTKQEASHIMRLGKKVFGENKASKGMLPLRAGEDFGYLNENKPGAYFFLTTAEGQNTPFNHCPNFDFNDKLIPKAAQFWLQLALDRLI